MGEHLIKSWSNTQHAVATLSAESESIAMIKGTSEGIGIARIMAEFGEDIGLRLWADASTALALVEREGVGKVRHIDVGVLWLQQKWLNKLLKFAKIPGAENAADLMTKGLCLSKIEGFMKDLKCEFRSGRAGKTVKLEA